MAVKRIVTNIATDRVSDGHKVVMNHGRTAGPSGESPTMNPGSGSSISGGSIKLYGVSIIHECRAGGYP